MMSIWLQRDIDVFLLRSFRHSKPLKSKTHHNLDDPAHRAWSCRNGEDVFTAARGLIESLRCQGTSAIYSADRQSWSGVREDVRRNRPRTDPARRRGITCA